MSKSYLFLKSGCTVPEETVMLKDILDFIFSALNKHKDQILVLHNENIHVY